MHGNVNEGMDDLLFIQGIFIIFQKASFRWHISIQLTSIDSKWAWVASYHRSNKTCAIVWLGNDHFAISHITCPTIVGRELFQTFQNNLWEIERY
jgi:hypothetical protein